MVYTFYDISIPYYNCNCNSLALYKFWYFLFNFYILLLFQYNFHWMIMVSNVMIILANISILKRICNKQVFLLYRSQWLFAYLLLLHFLQSLKFAFCYEPFAYLNVPSYILHVMPSYQSFFFWICFAKYLLRPSVITVCMITGLSFHNCSCIRCIHIFINSIKYSYCIYQFRLLNLLKALYLRNNQAFYSPLQIS